MIKKHMVNYKLDQNGIALLITLILLGTILTISLSIAILTTGEGKINRSINDSTFAIFAADAGMERLFYFVNRLTPPGNPISANLSPVVSFPSGTSYIACAASDNCTDSRLVSTGVKGGSRRSFEANY